MLRKPFFNMGISKIQFPIIDNFINLIPKEISLSPEVFLSVESKASLSKGLSVGDKVKTGQKLIFYKNGDGIVSPVTGTIKELNTENRSNLSSVTSLIINTEPDEYDESFPELLKSAKTDAETVFYLKNLPGSRSLSNISPNISYSYALIVDATEKEPHTITSQYALASGANELKEGINLLSALLKSHKTMITTFPYQESLAATCHNNIKAIAPYYPNSLDEIIFKTLFEDEISMDSNANIYFVGIEAVLAIARTLSQNKVQTDKLITVIDKKGTKFLIKTRIGTPVGWICKELGISTENKDLIAVGGPMRGKAVHNENTPVNKDTDSIFIQSEKDISWSSTVHCINCGDCIRACPSKIPVNMLVRVLENGIYEEAVRNFDLFSCIECGMCSYVCPAHIPILQYITLGKYEYNKAGTEDNNHV